MTMYFLKESRIILLDCSLEYKKGESQTNVEISAEGSWNWKRARTTSVRGDHRSEARRCLHRKGVSDLAQHFLLKSGISAVRRLRKSDNNRIARACGATIVNRTEELQESDVGTGAGLFEIKKIGGQYFCFITECKNPKVARNIYLNTRLVPGGGAIEMSVAQHLLQKATHGPYRALAHALEIVPKTLAQNCGANTIRTLTALRAKHANHTDANTPCTWGIDGETGDIVEMDKKVSGSRWPLSCKLIRRPVEAAILLLRIDDIVSGSKKKDGGQECAET
ncbi:hypothetical protein NQ317_007385 [Molorchus minor]|uniref:T-complex protein 1 subunit gamma n=1 Tax=Molorchus minor TaxID=1323400 RepID=A0ABQ9JUS0_9CUCU|nr:hypothetical protein NQ317_007385 [Molorchus minor]